MRGPALVLLTRAIWRSPAFLLKSASGRGRPGSANSPVTPRRKLAAQVWPPLSTSTSSRADSAFTTDAPTPCRPPEDLYAVWSNLPPACSVQRIVSMAGRLVFGWMSTGMPRPLSVTVTPPSFSRLSVMVVQNPFSASSTELSSVSHTRW